MKNIASFILATVSMLTVRTDVMVWSILILAVINYKSIFKLVSNE